MKNLKILAVLLVFLFTMSGCIVVEKIMGREKPEDVLAKIDNVYYEKIDTLNFEAKVKLIENQSQVDVSEADLVVQGKIDKTDEDNVIGEYLADGSIIYEGESFEGGIGLKVLSKNLAYLTISDEILSEVSEKVPFIASAMNLEKLKGKWITMAIPEEFSGATTAEEPVSEEEKELTKEQQKQLDQLYKETTFFVIIEELEDEEINGISTYHYKVNINKDETMNFFVKSSEILEEPMTVDEKESLEKSLEIFSENPSDVWIGKKDNYIYKFASRLHIKEQGYDLTVDIEIKFSDYNKPVEVEAPDPSEIIEETDLYEGTLSGLRNLMEPSVNLDKLEKTTDEKEMSEDEEKPEEEEVSDLPDEEIDLEDFVTKEEVEEMVEELKELEPKIKRKR